MSRPELGTKRTCPNCGAKYYDLNRDPIVCPRCGTYFETGLKARPVTAAVEEEDEDIEVEPEAEFVSLEEADEEAADSGAVKVEGDEDEEDEIEPAEQDDTFLEEEEEEEDVGDIIGDVDEEER